MSESCDLISLVLVTTIFHERLKVRLTFNKHGCESDPNRSLSIKYFSVFCDPPAPAHVISLPFAPCLPADSIIFMTVES